MSEARELEIDLDQMGPEAWPSESNSQLGQLADAIDLASDQGQRTWLTAKGRRIAAIVTVDEAELLDQLHQLCHCGPHDWKDECPLHGAERIGH